MTRRIDLEERTIEDGHGNQVGATVAAVEHRPPFQFGENGAMEAEELDSPPFKPLSGEELAARGFQRVNRFPAVHPSHLPTIVDLLEDEVQALRPCRDFVVWVANCAHADDCDIDPCSCLVDRAREVAARAGLLDHDGYATESNCEEKS